MTDDDSRSGLRIGGWIPPYRDAGHVIPRPSFPRRAITALTGFTTEPAGQSLAPIWQRRWVVLLGTVIVLLAAVLGYLNADRGPRPQTAAQLPAPMFPDFSAEPAVSVIPPAPPSSPTAAPTVPVATYKPTTTAAATRRPATTRPRSSSPSPSPTFGVGSTVSLAESGRPGLVVRHRDFRGRVEAIRTPQDRADASFTLRSGLANSGCVSLESVNYPGRFLRHRDFEIRLDRHDGSRLFRSDATFCPVPAGSSGVVLKSVNYPDRAVVDHNGRLYLAPGGTAFHMRKPL